MSFRQVQLCSALLISLLCACLGLAQNATGSINGTVTDPNNEVIMNATVTVTNRRLERSEKLRPRKKVIHGREPDAR